MLRHERTKRAIRLTSAQLLRRTRTTSVRPVTTGTVSVAIASQPTIALSATRSVGARATCEQRPSRASRHQAGQRPRNKDTTI
ncbi:uncharacterized protein LAESUDRAFT_114117 [Laetiporus sulphureus 93-53]|uniref:Uncharacterized protein n=1 Tax=Laetiporus sulphureus 93-53 TaxID=1314785 RepID=A0A165EQ13_9APHY|nr:uncharacterized protein LAESUDRAFT_114117 [Laetiporus sulphureus 93-53]KZT07525.1 hypothetical protein LAESUDRAFT_114117 [Laetiporus sulphureus 93-53]